ncbi:MAG: DUF1566 domain-containing protein [Syntrophales bacterium]|nr:DUF1566 domain-containing protein [Syntrophales bacterium]
MKKGLLIIIFLFLFGCTATANRIPDGKTEADWGADEQYCLNKSGKVTGFFAHTPIGLAVNVGGADEQYKNCLKELGWIKEPGDDNRPVIKKEPIKAEETASISSPKKETAEVAMGLRHSVSRASETGQDGHFIAYDDGTILDTRTGLMWAAKDNNAGITWQEAKKYCENYRGGGYTDWRMPTQDELATLYDSRINGMNGCNLTRLIELTKCSPWALENSSGAYFRFDGGGREWTNRPFNFFSFRALPVRSAK